MNKSKFHDRDIVLASSSPRRIEMLDELKIPFIVKPSEVKEADFNKSNMTPAEYALHNAELKASDIANKVKNSLVIGMDTVGELNGQIFEKPNDREHAKDMIRKLSGTTHNVITGICIKDSDSEVTATAAEITKVTFIDISDYEIDKYLDIASWDDAAAGYKIQAHGALFVERIEGDFFNVVGFPIYKFGHLMREIGVNLFELIRK